MSSAIGCEHRNKFSEEIPGSALCDGQNTTEPRVDQLIDASQALYSVTVKRRLSYAWISLLTLPSFCTLWRPKHDWATRGSADWRFPGSALCDRQKATEQRVDQLTDASQALHSVTVKTRLNDWATRGSADWRIPRTGMHWCSLSAYVCPFISFV